MRLDSFDYFRGLAILLIVAGHTLGPWSIDTMPEMIVGNLILGATALFVFISGFFFHYKFYARFRYEQFIGKKATNVLLPYCFLTLLALAVKGLWFGEVRFEGLMWSEILTLSVQYLWTGQIFSAYWYVPFIMLMFVLSPVFICYIRLTTRVQLILLFAFVAFSMWAHRPLGNLSPWHSVVYYLSIYLLGIVYSQYNKKIRNFIAKKSVSLGLLTLLIVLTQIVLYGDYRNFHKPTIGLFNGFDIMILQKIALIFFVLSVLEKLGRFDVYILKYLANLSFAIYFIHPWVIFFIDYYHVLDVIEFLPGAIIFVIKFLCVMALSILIARVVKLALKDRSRYFIGW